jgi:hypothetical protein
MRAAREWRERSRARDAIPAAPDELPPRLPSPADTPPLLSPHWTPPSLPLPQLPTTGKPAVPGAPFRYECPEGSKVISASSLMDVSGDLISGERRAAVPALAHTCGSLWPNTPAEVCTAPCMRHLAAVRIECDNAPGVRSLSLETVVATANALVLNTTAQLSTADSTNQAANVTIIGRRRYISPELVTSPPRTAYYIQVRRPAGGGVVVWAATFTLCASDAATLDIQAVASRPAVACPAAGPGRTDRCAAEPR